MSLSQQDVDHLAKIVWDYMLLHQPLHKADVIAVFGSYDVRVAEYGVDLYEQGYAPYLLFSGAANTVASKLIGGGEAEVFAAIARRRGVPEDRILVEDKATKTRENVAYTRALLEDRCIKHDTLLSLQKPYMERRTYATMKKLWPEQDFIISSPPISFEDYPNDVTGPRFLYSLLNDCRGIKELAEKGIQIPQEIPTDVWAAYETLAAAGYAAPLPAVSSHA